MIDDEARKSWLERVLGIRLSDEPNKINNDAVMGWNDARDAVEEQLHRLAAYLGSSDVPELMNVADEVRTLANALGTKISLALQECETTSDNPNAVKAALVSIGDAIAWLSADDRVSAVDDNPFGVKVSLGATLGKALRRLKSEFLARQKVMA